jgi:hypothetical protein
MWNGRSILVSGRQPFVGFDEGDPMRAVVVGVKNKLGSERSAWIDDIDFHDGRVYFRCLPEHRKDLVKALREICDIRVQEYLPGKPELMFWGTGRDATELRVSQWAPRVY